MSTQEIKNFHAAKSALDMTYELNIPNLLHLEAVRAKINQLVQDIEWAPFRNDLLRHYHRLDEYRVKMSCWKSIDEIEKTATSFPNTLLQQINGLHGTPSEIQQKVIKMLENLDWEPYRSRLECLKLRLDVLTKEKTIDPIDRVGITNLISSISRSWIHLKDLEVCPELMNVDLHYGCLTKLAIEIHPSFVFERLSTGSTQTVLGYVCAYDTSQLSLTKLMIRAGADVNGGIVCDASLGIVPPLCHAFASRWHGIKTQCEILQLLLNAGADPNLVTRPTSSPSGISSLIFDLIFKTNHHCVDELLPTLVDAGMNVDALQVCSSEDTNAVAVVTPLMAAISTGYTYYSNDVDKEEKKGGTFVPSRMSFARALIFNNATVHEATRKKAKEHGLLEQLVDLVRIRDAVRHDLMAPVRTCLCSPLDVIVSGYWTPNVPELRTRCYASIRQDPPPEEIRPSWCTKLRSCTIS